MNNNFAEQISRWYEEHQDELISDLQTLVRIPSVQGEPLPGAPFGAEVAKALETALEMGRRYGFETRNIDGHIGEISCCGTSGKSIAMIGHLDVVPVTPDGWSFPPFEAHIDENGWMVARGCSDNKNGAILALYAMRCIKELGLPFPHELRLMLGCDEENGMSDVGWYGEHRGYADLTLVPDAAFPVCFAEKGILNGDLRSYPITDGSLLAAGAGTASNVVPDKAWVVLPVSPEALDVPATPQISFEEAEGGVKFTAKGLSSHGAHPSKGENAIFLLANYLLGHSLLKGQARAAFTFIRNALTGCNGEGLGIASVHEHTGCLTFNGGMLSYNGSLFLNFNIRYPRSINSENICARISQAAEESGFALVNVEDSVGPYREPGDPLVTTLTGIYNEITDRDDKPYYMGGGTYARRMPNAVAFGPGMPLDDLPPCTYTGGAHQPDEHIHIRQVVTGSRIYALSLMAIGQNPDIL